MTQQQAALLLSLSQASVSRQAAANPTAAYVNPEQPRQGLRSEWVEALKQTMERRQSRKGLALDGVTISEAARALGATREQIRQAIATGKVAAEMKIGIWIIEQAEFERFKAQVETHLNAPPHP